MTDDAEQALDRLNEGQQMLMDDFARWLPVVKDPVAAGLMTLAQQIRETQLEGLEVEVANPEEFPACGSRVVLGI